MISYTARDTIRSITPQGAAPWAAFEYDLRGRLTRSTVGGVVGSFAYDARGLYTEIRFSSGAVLQFRWNDAQQLIDIRDETGQVYAPQVAMGPDAVLPLGQALAQLYVQGRGAAQRGLAALGDSLVPPAAAQVGVVSARFLEALQLAAAAQRKPRDLGAGKCCAAGESLLSQAEGGSASDQMVLFSPAFLLNAASRELAVRVRDALILATTGGDDRYDVCKRPPIPDVKPRDLCELLALAEAKAGAGVQIMESLADEPRLIAFYGSGPWVKRQHIHQCPGGKILNIHYFHSKTTLRNVELKFVGI